MHSMPTPSWRELLTTPVHLLAFGFGTGLAPKAPGTVGTLVGIPFTLALMPFGATTFIAVTALLFVVGVWICERSSQLLGVHDHGGIVWDEIVGYLVTFTPLLIWPDLQLWKYLPLWGWLMVAFLLFRVFDVIKPWPIKVVDRRVDGGFGIMVDDLIAGIAAAALMVLPAIFI